MRCTNRQRCCRDTMMELSEAAIVRLERRGHRRDVFVVMGEDRIPRLRNVDGWCIFYDPRAGRCREYRSRPLGCVIYPVNLDEDGDIIVDDLCPQAGTIPAREMEERGRRLRSLLDTIDREAEGR
ncbi:MAG TPA: YkgJ family cysteine cluster protein [Methanomassiliicoccaceae archaeon]|nr:YkgJ family cysteine cluster protein [Methanomassiliicoccaceae archaeon]HPP44620.1 YkgJ family cysteine cluster protein [Methanomassiliicoccaceae archaeon]